CAAARRPGGAPGLEFPEIMPDRASRSRATARCYILFESTSPRPTPTGSVAAEPRLEDRVSSPWVTGAVLVVLLACVLVLTSFVPPAAEADHAAPPEAPPHHLEGGFRNVDPGFAHPSLWRRMWSLLGRLGPMLRGDFRLTRVAAAASVEGAPEAIEAG